MDTYTKVWDLRDEFYRMSSFGFLLVLRHRQLAWPTGYGQFAPPPTPPPPPGNKKSSFRWTARMVWLAVKITSHGQLGFQIQQRHSPHLYCLQPQPWGVPFYFHETTCCSRKPLKKWWLWHCHLTVCNNSLNNLRRPRWQLKNNWWLFSL